MLTNELARTIFLSVINEEMAEIEVFMVGKNKSFVSSVSEMPLHPKQLI